MSSAPPVSVLLPVRDGAAHLEEAAASLSGQTFADFEVLAVDDGSSDATPELLADWAARDGRVRLLRQEPAGIVAALERARVSARGAVLARMDADDVCEPSRFERQDALLRSDPTLVGCGCRVRYFPDAAVRAGARRYERWLNACVTPAEVDRAMFVECPLAHPTFFLRADAVAAVGGYREMGWPEDYDLVLRLWGAGGRMAKVPEVLLHWREGAGRLSRTDGRYGPAAFRRCKVHHLRKTLLADGRPILIWGAGPVGKALSREARRQEVGLRAFAEVDPRKIGQEIHGVPVLDTEAALSEPGVLHVGAVGQDGVRAHLRGLVADAGLVEGSDFVAMA